MPDKHTKFWIFFILLTVMNVGAAASYMGERGTFYRGLEIFNAKDFQTSVLVKEIPQAPTIVESDTDAAQELQILAQTIKKEMEALPQPKPIVNPPILPPCPENQVPVIKDGKVLRCKPATRDPNDINQYFRSR